MTTAWYWHLNHRDIPLWKTILISWGVALFEYCLAVPANRMGVIQGFSAFQLKITQEVVTLIVFTVFAIVVLKEPWQWKYLLAFALLVGAVYIVFKK